MINCDCPQEMDKLHKTDLLWRSIVESISTVRAFRTALQIGRCLFKQTKECIYGWDLTLYIILLFLRKLKTSLLFCYIFCYFQGNCPVLFLRPWLLRNLQEKKSYITF